MNKKILYIILVLAVILIFAALIATPKSPSTGTENATTTIDQLISDGLIFMPFSSERFGFAVTKDQVQVESYIPPCDEAFNYCVYYTGTEYDETNFESAGIRVQHRGDLKTENDCLSKAPVGYDDKRIPDKKKLETNYSTSVFSNVGDAGMGHFASGNLYRLYVKHMASTSPVTGKSNDLNTIKAPSCYEFETRIGQTQYANYEPGTIEEFTDEDATTIRDQMTTIMNSVSLSTGERDLFR